MTLDGVKLHILVFINEPIYMKPSISIGGIFLRHRIYYKSPNSGTGAFYLFYNLNREYTSMDFPQFPLSYADESNYIQEINRTRRVR